MHTRTHLRKRVSRNVSPRAATATFAPCCARMHKEPANIESTCAQMSRHTRPGHTGRELPVRRVFACAHAQMYYSNASRQKGETYKTPAVEASGTHFTSSSPETLAAIERVCVLAGHSTRSHAKARKSSKSEPRVTQPWLLHFGVGSGPLQPHHARFARNRALKYELMMRPRQPTSLSAPNVRGDERVWGILQPRILAPRQSTKELKA